MTLQVVRSLLKNTYTSWSAHDAPRLGAALAFYTLLSISPLVVLLVVLVGFILSRTVAEQRILSQTSMMMGPQSSATLKNLIENAHHRGSGIAATIIALLTLFFGASGVFVELRNALNIIWDAPRKGGGGWRSVIKDKLISFAMVAGCGAFLLLSALVSAAFALIESLAADLIPLPAAVMGELLNLGISLVLLTALFGAIYKTVPNVKIGWADVGIGSAATAVLFLIGRAILSLYFSKGAVGSAYGAAGSLVALVIWIYYSAQIFFFGAVFTRVYSEYRAR